MPTLALGDFLGGLNLTADQLDLEPNESPNLLNMLAAGNGGALSVRSGDVALAGGAAPIAPDGLHFVSAGAAVLASRISTGQVYNLSLAGGIWSLVYSSAPSAGIVPPMTFIEAPISGGQGPIYGLAPKSTSPFATPVQGIFALGAWTASSGIIPLARFLLWAGNRVWAFGEGSNGTVADASHSGWWSDLGDPRSWPAANINKFSPGDGDKITAACAIGSSIIVFKQHVAWDIYDLDTGANRPLAYGIGALDKTDLSLNTAVATRLGIVFIDPDQGLMVTDGSSVNTLDKRRRVDTVRTIAPTLVSMRSAGDSVYFGLAGGEIYEYDLLHDAWWRHDGGGLLAITPIVVATVPPTPPSIFRTSYLGAAVVDNFKSSNVAQYSNGNPLTTRYTTPWLTAGDVARRKRFGPAFVRGVAPGAINMLVRHGLDPATWATRSLPFSGALSKKVRANGLGVSEALQLELDGATLLESVQVDYQARGR